MALRRNHLAVVLALVTAMGMGLAFFLSGDTRLLMPGPLTSGHAAMEKCSACHSSSGSSKMSWLHGLVAANPLADSKACLTCHKMPATAFNPHGASASVLAQRTRRLTKIAARSIAPRSATAQNLAFPMTDVIAGGLYCATCHQEHQGANFNLDKISNEQCRSCHVVKFDSFDAGHPKFENYPFERRTRIIFDHASHFGKHYPDLAKKDPAKRAPETCSTCHNSSNDRRVMATAPFDQTCATCHLGQIIGKERVSGPKGIAFLALPGLDLETLKSKNAPIGEWPDASDSALTPFMAMIISRNEPGRGILDAVEGLNLQDLATASEAQIKAVTDLVWVIKRLLHGLVQERASDVLATLNAGGGEKLSPAVIADLTAGIPRDVLIGAQQEWLPNLATEMATGPITPAKEPSGSNADQAVPIPLPQDPKIATVVEPEPAETESPGANQIVCADEPPEVAERDSAEATVPEAEPEEQILAEIKGRLPLPNGTPRAIRARDEDAKAKPDDRKEVPCVEEQPRVEAEAQADDVAGASEVAATEAPPAESQADGQATEQFDDLLFPTGAAKDGQTEAADGSSEAEDNTLSGKLPDAGIAAASPQIHPALVARSESGVDPETWAEYGGWYRQDYTVYYRPTGHKDRFIHSWLMLTGPQAPKGGASPAAAVFDYLASKDAQGSCTKCHSIDDVRGKARVVNFSPAPVAGKQGRFTNFIHEPHMAVMDSRGCLTCHGLEKNRPYLKSYEQDNPRKFTAGFGPVKEELCQTCHTSSKARQDCLLCHKYHVNAPVTPIMNTRIPAQTSLTPLQ